MSEETKRFEPPREETQWKNVLPETNGVVIARNERSDLTTSDYTSEEKISREYDR